MPTTKPSAFWQTAAGRYGLASGTLLGATALLKLLALVLLARADRADLVLPFLTVKTVTFLAAMLELGAVLALLRSGSREGIVAVNLWLVFIVGLYRGANHLAGGAAPCSCFGGARLLEWEPYLSENQIAWTIISFLGLPPLGWLVAKSTPLWRRRPAQNQLLRA